MSGQANAMAQYMVVLNSQELGRTCWATRSSVGSFARTTHTFACFTLPGRPRSPTYVLLFLVMCTRLCTPLFWLVGPLVSRLVSNSFVFFFGIFQAVFPSLPLPICLQLILTCIWPSSPCSSRALQKKRSFLSTDHHILGLLPEGNTWPAVSFSSTVLLIHSNSSQITDKKRELREVRSPKQVFWSCFLPQALKMI